MNYLFMILLSILCLGIGWFFAYSQAGEQFQIIEKTDSFIEETKDFLQDANDLLQIEKFQLMQAESDIYMLEYLDNKKYVLVEEEVINSLGRYYKSAKESMLDGMESNDEERLVRKINNLSKENVFFKRVVEYK